MTALEFSEPYGESDNNDDRERNTYRYFSRHDFWFTWKSIVTEPQLAKQLERARATIF